jgi:hypothetical protein
MGKASMRRIHALKYAAVALLVGLLGQGVAGAQAPDGTADVDPTPSKQVNLSIPEQLEAGTAYLNRMESIRSNVSRDLEEARQQRDVVKTLCLNDKLNQLDVALRSGGERYRALESAAKRGDQDLTSHEFTILTVLHQRSQQLDAEAKQCIGKEVGFVGESSIRVDIEPGMPDEDVTDGPDFSVVVTPPDCASCYM